MQESYKFILALQENADSSRTPTCPECTPGEKVTTSENRKRRKNTKKNNTNHIHTRTTNR